MSITPDTAVNRRPAPERLQPRKDGSAAPSFVPSHTRNPILKCHKCHCHQPHWFKALPSTLIKISWWADKAIPRANKPQQETHPTRISNGPFPTATGPFTDTHGQVRSREINALKMRNKSRRENQARAENKYCIHKYILEFILGLSFRVHITHNMLLFWVESWSWSVIVQCSQGLWKQCTTRNLRTPLPKSNEAQGKTVRCLVVWQFTFSADSIQCGPELNVSVKAL